MNAFNGFGNISTPGIVVLGPSLQVVASNAEAIRILGYPENPGVRTLDRVLSAKFSLLMKEGASGVPRRELTQIVSGRRRYVCRLCPLDPTKNVDSAHFIVLLERVPSAEGALHIFSRQFNLTVREQEALRYMLQGLTSKEIASRMNISVSTLKTFFRFITTKAGVDSRRGVVALLAGLHPESPICGELHVTTASCCE